MKSIGNCTLLEKKTLRKESETCSTIFYGQASLPRSNVCFRKEAQVLGLHQRVPRLTHSVS